MSGVTAAALSYLLALPDPSRRDAGDSEAS